MYVNLYYWCGSQAIFSPRAAPMLDIMCFMLVPKHAVMRGKGL